jgi:probable F420-dependent oxidoreductase
MAPPNRPGEARTLVVGERRESVHFTTTPALAVFARQAEELGFDAVWLPDHVVMPARYSSRYPYQADAAGGDFRPYPFDDVPFPEPFTALAFIGGATHTIRLCTGVLILPERNPVLFAKQAATLDGLTGGRLQLGVGIGWLREEFEALGLTWDHRGRRMDECIEAIRALWRDRPATYHGEFVSFDEIVCDPLPVQTGGVPLIVGGHSAAAARRAGRLGNGFVPTGLGGKDDRVELIRLMKGAAEKAGRDPAEVPVYAGATADPTVIDQLVDEGVGGVFIAAFPTDLDAARRWLDDTASRLGLAH